MPLTDEEQQAICQLNAKEVESLDIPDKLNYLSIPSHQIGGEPWLVQTGWDCWQLSCPLCSHEMLFLASISNDALLPRGFADYDFLQIIYSYCPTCQVVGAVQGCD